MHVLIVFAHPSPRSFCRAVLERAFELGKHVEPHPGIERPVHTVEPAGEARA